MHRREGFSAIETLIVIVILSIIGLIGYWTYQNNQKTDTGSSSTSSNEEATKETQETNEPTNETFKVLSGAVTLSDNGVWKTATGGYWSIESGRCGRGTDVDQDCLDHIMLIPKTETFTNPDQFQVNISVFRVEEPLDGDSQKLRAWVDLQVASNNEGAKRSYSTIDGQTAYRNEFYYSSDRVEERDTAHLVHAVAFDDKVVVIRSNLFNGDHYSHKTSNNYLPFMTEVDKLAKSIRF